MFNVKYYWIAVKKIYFNSVTRRDDAPVNTTFNWPFPTVNYQQTKYLLSFISTNNLQMLLHSNTEKFVRLTQVFLKKLLR